jgi:hypothetical protein
VPRQAAIWGSERIDEIFDLIENGAVYRFKAGLKTDNTFNRLSVPEKVDNAEFPEISDIEPIAMDDLMNALGTNEIIRGWVTRIIKSGPEVIGYEIADLGVSPPVTIWFAGQYSKIPVERQKELEDFQLDDELVVFGYINAGSGGTSVNALNIYRVE